jgi:predicted RNA-binding Zn-ribbon protein involved in translation (DUF1610 family)
VARQGWNKDEIALIKNPQWVKSFDDSWSLICELLLREDKKSLLEQLPTQEAKYRFGAEHSTEREILKNLKEYGEAQPFACDDCGTEIIEKSSDPKKTAIWHEHHSKHYCPECFITWKDEE